MGTVSEISFENSRFHTTSIPPRENQGPLHRVFTSPELGQTGRRVEWVDLQYAGPNVVPSTGYASIEELVSITLDNRLEVDFHATEGSAEDEWEIRIGRGTRSPGVIMTRLRLAIGLVDLAFRTATANPHQLTSASFRPAGVGALPGGDPEEQTPHRW